MVITQVFGGLGNQLFQYAAGRRLALARHAELKLDLSAFREGGDQRAAGLEAFRRHVMLFEFNVPATEASPAEIAKYCDPHRAAGWGHRAVRLVRRVHPGFLHPATHFKEKGYRFDPAVLSLGPDVYLQGFWQSWKYFADTAVQLRADLTPKDTSRTDYIQSYLAELRGKHGPIVSLHVRRGDLAHAVEAMNRPDLVHGGPIGLDYIHTAIQKFPDAGAFLVFSDTDADLDWCRDNIKCDKLLFSRGHAAVVDMLLMSQCDHHITANSTFSWWACWLGEKPGKRVITPRRWSGPHAKKDMPTDDLLPPAWETL